MMTTNLFIIANVKKTANLGSFRILLPFFQTSCSVGILNSAIFNSFHNRVESGTILEGLQNFGGGGWTPQTPPSVRHWLWGSIKCEEILDWLTNCQLLKKVSGALGRRCKESAAKRDECNLSLSAARTCVRACCQVEERVSNAWHQTSRFGQRYWNVQGGGQART